MDEEQLDALSHLLWPAPDSVRPPRVFWLLDGARDPAIVQILRAGHLAHACLFAGTLHPRLQAAAPYLVQLTPGAAATRSLLNAGWGQAWGILARTPPDCTLEHVRLHFKKLLRVRTEEGRELMFRFYDPRVLGVFLPTCTLMELKTMLGPATCLVAEGAGGAEAHRFDIEHDTVRIGVHRLAR